MLFNHYVDTNETNAIRKACRNFDFGEAFDKFDANGSYDRDRKYDLLALAVAGVPDTRRALADGVDLDDYGNAYFDIPSQSSAHAHNDRDLTVEGWDVVINVPVLRNENDAERWISELNISEKRLAKMFLMELYCYAVDAYNEEGRYIEGVSCPEYPEWLVEEKGA